MKTILILHSFLFIQLFGYASRMEESFLFKNDTIIPNQGEQPVAGSGLPKYPGGEAQMLKDLQENLVYPKLEKAKCIQGIVYVEFYVETDGTVSDVKVIRGIKDGKSFDNAAIQAVKKLKKFSPTMVNGKPIRVPLTIPVHFKLPEETNVEPKNNKP